MKVMMNFQGNLGYAADQIDGPITLGQLLEQVQEAVTEWGEDAEVVMFQTNNGRGANYGRLYRDFDLFEAVVNEDEDY